MSVASEITRLQNAKADLKTAIEGKGVTVSADAKLDAYPALVESIQQGGGGNDDNWYFITADGNVTTPDNELVRQIYLGYENSAGWSFREHVIRGYALGLKCWFRYKGEDYFVDSFSDGMHILSKQGVPVSCTISDLLSMNVSKDNDVYKIEYYDD